MQAEGSVPDPGADTRQLGGGGAAMEKLARATVEEVARATVAMEVTAKDPSSGKKAAAKRKTTGSVSGAATAATTSTTITPVASPARPKASKEKKSKAKAK